MDAVIRHVETDYVTQANKLAVAAALWVAKEVGVKKGKIGEKKERWWKRRIENDITNLRRGINKLERERRGETAGKGKTNIKELNTKYRVKKKGINLVTEEGNQKFTAKKTKVKRYEQRISQFSQNQLSQVTRNRGTIIWMEKNKVIELSLILKIISNFRVISGVYGKLLGKMVYKDVGWKVLYRCTHV